MQKKKVTLTPRLIVQVRKFDLLIVIQELDTGIHRRIPISQCYFKDN